MRCRCEVYYSNRSAAHAALQQWREALEDAQACTRLKPRWGKAWSRRGAAQSGLELHGEVGSGVQAFHLGPSWCPELVAVLIAYMACTCK